MICFNFYGFCFFQNTTMKYFSNLSLIDHLYYYLCEENFQNYSASLNFSKICRFSFNVYLNFKLFLQH